MCFSKLKLQPMIAAPASCKYRFSVQRFKICIFRFLCPLLQREAGGEDCQGKKIYVYIKQDSCRQDYLIQTTEPLPVHSAGLWSTCCVSEDPRSCTHNSEILEDLEWERDENTSFKSMKEVQISVTSNLVETVCR